MSRDARKPVFAGLPVGEIEILFKVEELSGNLAKCQGNLKFLENVREMSGNF